MGHTPYSERFLQPAAVDAYEHDQYSPGTYWSALWTLQQPLLQAVFQQQRLALGSLKALDFACGTGRVLSLLEPFADKLVGVDISTAMAERARTRCPRAMIVVGDICSGRLPISGRYDVITVFRFLLNAETELRRTVLMHLRNYLDEEHGLLVLNVHGNARSLRHLGILRRRLLSPPSNGMLAEMTNEETCRLLDSTGYSVSRMCGYGLMLPILYRTPFRKLAFAVDRYTAARQWLPHRCVDLVFICKPKPLKPDPGSVGGQEKIEQPPAGRAAENKPA